MSDMTDAEFLRVLAKRKGVGTGRLTKIANLLDAMQWRKEPPDLEGDWVQKRDGSHRLAAVRAHRMAVFAREHHPGDLWFKLPEAKPSTPGNP